MGFSGGYGVKKMQKKVNLDLSQVVEKRGFLQNLRFKYDIH